MSKKSNLQVKYHHLSPKGILSLLKQGAKIIFPSGFYMQGDPSTSYIDVGSNVDGKSGLWNLNVEGVKSAINDAKQYELAELMSQNKLNQSKFNPHQNKNNIAQLVKTLLKDKNIITRRIIAEKLNVHEITVCNNWTELKPDIVRHNNQIKANNEKLIIQLIQTFLKSNKIITKELIWKSVAKKNPNITKYLTYTYLNKFKTEVGNHNYKITFLNIKEDCKELDGQNSNLSDLFKKIKVSELDKKIYKMHYVDNLTMKMISDYFKINLSTVKVKLYRLKNKLIVENAKSIMKIQTVCLGK